MSTPLRTLALQSFFQNLPASQRTDLLIQLIQDANQEKRRVKVVYNRRHFGLYCLSPLALRVLEHLDVTSAPGVTVNETWSNQAYFYARDHPYLVRVIEKLERLASGPGSELVIHEVELGLMETYDISHNDRWRNESVLVKPLTQTRPLYLITRTDEEIDQIIDSYRLET